MERIKELSESLIDKWKNLEKIKKVSFVFASISLITLIILSIFLLNRTDYSVLFSDLSDEESGQITKNLDDSAVKYKLEDKGSKILVDSSSIDKVRINLAVENQLPSKSTGFEIFDEKNMMATDEDRKIMYQRAVTGELQRSIESLDSVQDAKVMLVTPDKSIFEEKNKESTASIVLKLKSGQLLSEEAIKGIASLTSGAVENLPQKNIKIVDEKGNVLSAILDENRSDYSSDIVNKYQKIKDEVEEKLETKTQSLLGTLFKDNQLNLAINVDLDFDSIEKTTVTYDDPKVRSEVIQATGEEINQQELEGNNVRDNVNNVVGDNADGTQSYNHTINNELDTETTKVLNAPGVVKKITASILIQENLTPAETNQIQELVQSAVGYDQARGDRITVQAMTFNSEEEVVAESEELISPEIKNYFTNPIVWGIIGSAILILIVFIALIFKSKKKKADEYEMLSDDLDVSKPIVRDETTDVLGNKDSFKTEVVNDEIRTESKLEIKNEVAKELLEIELQKEQVANMNSKENEAKRYAKENPELAAELIKIWMKDK